MDVQAKIVKLCEDRGWDQADLARAITRVTGEVISRATVNAWYNGKGQPNLRSGLLLSRALGVTLDYLADDAQDDPIKADSLGELEAYLVEKAREIGVKKAIDRILLRIPLNEAIQPIEQEPSTPPAAHGAKPRRKLR